MKSFASVFVRVALLVDDIICRLVEVLDCLEQVLAQLIDFLPDRFLGRFDDFVHVGLHVAIGGLLCAHKVFNGVLKFLVLRVELLAEVIHLVVHAVGDLVDGAFPFVVVDHLGLHWLDNVHEHLLLLSAAALTNCACHLNHELQLTLRRIDIAILDYTLEHVAHDGDQHVEHGNLGEECRAQEQHIADHSLRLVRKIVVVELTERELVLVQEHVKEPVIEGRLDNFCICCSIQVEHDHRQTEKHE